MKKANGIQFILKSLILVMTLTFAIGCNPKFDNKSQSENSSGPSSVNSHALKDFVQVSVQPAADPEKYFVYFSWPRIEDKKRLRIRTDRVLTTVSPDQTTFNHQVDHNQTLAYTFEILDDASRVDSHFPKQVLIPRDYIVDSKHPDNNVLMQDTVLAVERVFLSESNTPLNLNGHSFTLTTNELHVTGATIETMPDNSKATIDKDGKNAGDIKISAKVATGSLKIIMRGEDGGDGSNGIPFSSPAASGTAPGSSSYNCTPDFNGGPGCAQQVCANDGTRGGRGSDGQKGHKGKPAHPGGDTGHLSITVEDGREFTIVTAKHPGAPGTSGIGGPGQIGGRGGFDDNPSDCVGLEGPRGSDGAAGDPGEKADPGKNQEACIVVHSEGVNECN